LPLPRQGCQSLSSQLAYLLEASLRPGSLMAIIRSLYCDESGKFLDKKVITFCGLCASPSALDKFEDRWNQELRRTGLHYLTMKEALQADKELGPLIPKQSIKERIEVLKPFAACLVETFEFGVVIAVNVEAFRRTADQIKRETSGGENPIYFSFINSMLQVGKHALDDDKVSLICDDDQGTAERFLKLYRRLKNIPEADCRKFCSITFADDITFAPLQAADMLASLARIQSDFEFYGTPYDYQPLFEYLAEPRGPAYIRWAVGFIGERKMAKLELNWKPHRQEP